MLTKLYYFLHRMASRPDEKNEPTKGYWQNKVRQATLALTAQAHGKLLEIGCGEGLFLSQLAKRNPALELWGIDHDPAMLDLARKKFLQLNLPHITIAHQEADRPGLQDTFDTVVCINVFICMPTLETVRATLVQMKKLCAPSGKIVFDFRNAQNPLLVLKYKLAKYYDGTLKDHPLSTFYPRQIETILNELNFTITQRRCIGLRMKSLAPIIVIEAQHNAY